MTDWSAIDASPIFPPRRRLLVGTACAAAMPALSLAQTNAPTSPEDLAFMRMAIDEARQADFPFGAVIVRPGRACDRYRVDGARACVLAGPMAGLPGVN